MGKRIEVIGTTRHPEEDHRGTIEGLVVRAPDGSLKLLLRDDAAEVAKKGLLAMAHPVGGHEIHVEIDETADAGEFVRACEDDPDDNHLLALPVFVAGRREWVSPTTGLRVRNP